MASGATFGEDRGNIVCKVSCAQRKSEEKGRQQKAHAFIIGDMNEATGWRPLTRLLAIVLLGVVACGGILTAAYFRVATRTESTRNATAMLEKLVLANRYVEVAEVQAGAERIRGVHVPSRREMLFTFRELRGGRTAVGFEDYPVAPNPGGRVPPWVPVYSGAQVKSHQHKQHPDYESGELVLLTATPAPALQAFYVQALHLEGMTVAEQSLPKGAWIARAHTRDHVAYVTVGLVPRERGTEIGLQYSGR